MDVFAWYAVNYPKATRIVSELLRYVNAFEMSFHHYLQNAK